MFTGIIAAIGKIIDSEPLADGVRLTVSAGTLDLDDVGIGDSIAHDGICLTVIEKQRGGYTVDVSRETLNVTVGLGPENTSREVNLEKALTLADRLGGHLVSGHVDGIGKVVRFAPVGESHELVIRVPRELARYVARKGSLTINGVSLTTNRVEDGQREGESFSDVSINLIQHTVAVTTLKHLHAGSRVNLEVDLIARYCERLLSTTRLS